MSGSGDQIPIANTQERIGEIEKEAREHSHPISKDRIAVAREFWETFLAEAEDLHKALGEMLPVVESIATQFPPDVEELKIIKHARRVFEHWGALSPSEPGSSE